jgi:hypothetical protein
MLLLLPVDSDRHPLFGVNIHEIELLYEGVKSIAEINAKRTVINTNTHEHTQEG